MSDVLFLVSTTSLFIQKIIVLFHQNHLTGYFTFINPRTTQLSDENTAHPSHGWANQSPAQQDGGVAGAVFEGVEEWDGVACVLWYARLREGLQQRWVVKCDHAHYMKCRDQGEASDEHIYILRHVWKAMKTIHMCLMLSPWRQQLDSLCNKLICYFTKII